MMKIRYFILFLILGAMLCTTVFAAEETTFFWDDAGMLTNTEEAEVNAQLAQLSQSISMNIIAVTANDYGTAEEDGAAAHFYEKSSTDNGVILLLHFSEYGNSYYISAYGTAWEMFNDRAYDKVEDACVPLLRNGDYEEAILAYGKACKQVVTSHGKLPTGGIVLCILIGAGLSFLNPMNILKGQLKTVRRQPGASSYIQKDSMVITNQRDTFLYKNISRVAKPKNNGSSGGGSRSGGGGGGGRGGSF
jgi:uncharacterized protein